MSFISNIHSSNNNSFSLLTPMNVSSLVELPKDFLSTIGGYLNQGKELAYFACAHRNFYFLISDSLFSESLWHLFLRKDFPYFCEDRKPKLEVESPALYKRLATTVHNMKTRKHCLRTFKGQKSISCMTVWDGNKLISGLGNGKIKILDLSTGEELRTIDDHQGMINCLTVWDGNKLISGSYDDTIKIWNLSTGQEIQTLNGHRDSVTCLTVWDGDKLISGSYDTTIKIWDLSTGQEIQTLGAHQDLVTCMTIWDGNKLISGSSDWTIKIWDLSTGQEIQTLIGHEGKITSMMILGNNLISGSEDRTIRIWNLSTKQEIQTLKGHRNSINSLAHLADKLISSSADRTIKIWDLATGKEFQTLYQDSQQITCLVALNDDKLISVSRDGTVNIWNFNYPSKQVLEERRGKDIPFFLIDLGIIDKKECSNKLNCTPDHLSEIGICSSADLKALGLFKNSFHFDYLKVIAEEDIQEHDQLRKIKRLQDSAFKKREIVLTLLEDLYKAVGLMANEAERGALFHGKVNIWISFRNELNHFQAILEEQCNNPQKIVQTFNLKSYTKIVQEMNLIIDEFRRLEREHQIAILFNYVDQRGIFKVWNEIYKKLHGIGSISSLLERNDMAPKDLFRMGI